MDAWIEKWTEGEIGGRTVGRPALLDLPRLLLHSIYILTRPEYP